MDASPTTEADTEPAISFARTLCAIDSSPQSMEAVSHAFGSAQGAGKSGAHLPGTPTRSAP